MPSPAETSHAALEAVLRQTLQTDEQVWILAERYHEQLEHWDVDLLRQSDGAWFEQRYRYDVPSKVLYFLGTRPLPETDLAPRRRNGRKLVATPLTPDLG